MRVIGHATGEVLASRQQFFATAAIMLGIFMGALDSSIVNIALPGIAAAFRAKPASAVWVVNSYQLSSAVFMLIAAAIAQARGQRRVFGAGVVIFTLSSLGCAMAGSISELVAMRALQGIGYAAMVTVGLGLYRAIFPPGLLSTVLGWNALVVAFGTTIGPVVGGGMIAWFSWPWLFIINVPLGLFAIVFTGRSLPRDAGNRNGFDLIGALLSAGALSGLVIGVDQLGSWSAMSLAGLFAVSVLLAALWICWLGRVATPLVPLEIFRSRRFSMAIVSSLCMFAAQGLAMVALPFVLQHDYGFRVLNSAWMLVPWPLAVVIVVPVAGKLTARMSGTLLSSMGVMLMSCGLAAIAFLPAHAGVLAIAWRVGLCGAGYGLFLPPNNSEILGNVPKAFSSIGSGVLSTAKAIGQSLGAALVAATFAIVSGFGPHGVSFVRLAFVTAAALSIVSSVVSVMRVHR